MTDPKDLPGLKCVLDCLKRSADNSECWPVYPAEAGAIISTIERLRKENEELRGDLPAVVSYLRGRPGYGPVADRIERGEHRREEEP
jgi:hypothetical protein